MKQFSVYAITAVLAMVLAVAGFAGTKANQTLEGKLVCLGCTLKKNDGVQAQCSTYGHKGALQTSDGSLWSFVENDRSKKLINDTSLHGKSVKVTGTIIEKAKRIDVASYEVDGKKQMWCEKCKMMGPEHSH